MVSTVSRYGKQLRHATTMPLQLVRNTWPTRKYDTNPHSEEPGTSERSHNSHRTENSSSKTSFPPGKVSQRREIICMSTCGSSSTWKTPVCMSVCMKFCTHVRVYIYIYIISTCLLPGGVPGPPAASHSSKLTSSQPHALSPVFVSCSAPSLVQCRAIQTPACR